MRGHLRRRGKGSWAIVIDLGRHPQTGARQQKWFSIRGTRKDAERKQVQLLHSFAAGTYVERSNLTVAEFLRRWLDEHVEPNLTPKARQRYGGVVHNHLIPAFGALPLAELRPGHVLAAYAKWRENGRIDGRGGLSPRTLGVHHGVLSKAMHHAVERRVLALNPMDGVPAPRFEKRQMPVLDDRQLRTLLDACRDSYIAPLVHVAALTGLRRSELTGLAWDSLDFERGVLQVRQTCQWIAGEGFVFKGPKTATSRRSVALPHSVVRVLRDQQVRQAELERRLGPAFRNVHGLVFTSRLGRPIGPRNLSRDYRRIVQSLDIPYITWHGLRHTHATLMLKIGVHPKVVSERLGHSSVAFTLDCYSSVLPGLQEAAAQRLDAMIADESGPGTEIE